MGVGIGVEIGAAGVRGAVVERIGSRIALRGAARLPADAASAEQLTEALDGLRRRLRIRSPIVLGLPGASAILMAVSPLIPNPRRSLIAVQFELQQQLPFLLSGAVWHAQWLAGDGRDLSWRPERRTVGSPGAPPTALAAAMRRALLEDRLACCRRAELSVQAVTINPLGTLNAWSWAQAGPPSPSSTASALAPSDDVATQGPRPRVLLEFLRDGAAQWILWGHASLQVVPVDGPSPEALWGAVAASAEALQVREVARERIVWCLGPTTVMPKVRELIEAQGLQTRAVELAPAGSADVAAELEGSIAAVGLALQGARAAPLSINLLSRAQHEARLRRARRTTAMANGLCAVALAGLVVSGMRQMRARRLTALESLAREEQLYQTLRPDVRRMVQRQREQEERRALLERLVTQGPLLGQALGRIVEALPDAAWLTKLECAKHDQPVRVEVPPVASPSTRLSGLPAAPSARAAPGGSASSSDGEIERTSGGLIDGVLEGRARSFQDVTQFLDRLKSVAGMTVVRPLSTSVIAEPSTLPPAASTGLPDRQAGSGVAGAPAVPPRRDGELIVFTVQIQAPLAAPSLAPGSPADVAAEEAAEATPRAARRRQDPSTRRGARQERP